MSKSETPDTTARAWIARLKSGDATRADAYRFKAWRERSAENEQAFRQALHLWELSGRAVEAQGVRPALSRRRFVLQGAGLAAAAVTAQQAAVFLGFARSLHAWSADQSTPTGVVEALDLTRASGSLDGASAIAGAGADRIRLLEGAVFLSSIADGDSPRNIDVEAGGLVASLSDGALELRITDRGAEITCAAGEIRVAAPVPHDLRAGDSLEVLATGEAVRSDRGPEEIASWRRGVLTFRKRRLADVLSVLNRHRTGRVLLRRAGLADRLVSGVFHLDRPDEIVSHLVTTLRLGRSDLPGRVVLLG